MIKIIDILEKAVCMGACALAKRSYDTWEELSRLFLSPQGIEFCQNNKFPSLKIWEDIKKSENVRKIGYHINNGEVIGCNSPYIVIVGNTSAKLTFNSLGMYRVILMHGAKADIEATNYAVLNIVKIGDCKVNLKTDKTVRLT